VHGGTVGLDWQDKYTQIKNEVENYFCQSKNLTGVDVFVGARPGADGRC